MEPTAPTAPSDLAPDPPQDQCASNVEFLLHAARILLTYGRHLIDTVRHRATAPNFNAIAANFGTANLATILAHLNRGILRAAALERVLLARAAAGKDIDFIERNTWKTLLPEPDPAEDPQPEQPAAAARLPATRKQAPRACRPAGRAVAQLMTEKTRRRAAFANEQDRNPKATWEWINISRDALRQVLGFFIGEPPVNPLDPAAAIATAPP
jgi:hypothetical protein